MNKTYRTDIDGLRAIAVISVILFHLGYLTNGYLGVDIFFVISGYLITGLVYNEVEKNKFSVLNFYERRIRRIFPLVLFTTSIAFILGLIFMLPDDLENLSQSVFASNLSVNNILMKITSGDYWAVKNDYKPLMHTWSLGIEEQFYLLYPVIFFFLKGDRKKFILPLLFVLTILSLAFFLKSNDASSKFYFLQYRFFELSIGGICSIYFSKPKTLLNFPKSHYILYFLLALVVFLLYVNSIKSNDIKVIITTILTAGILVLGGLHFENNALYKAIISNKVFTGIGKISFSLYMWHHIVFAFSRYSLIEEITIGYAIALSILVIVLSIISYYIIENPFRNRTFIKTRPLLVVVGLSFLIVNAVSIYMYAIGGIIRDVPELGITKANRQKQLNFFGKRSNIHVEYNESIKRLDAGFSSTNKIKILVIGDSFSKDFANILLESSFAENAEVSHAYAFSKQEKNRERFEKADFIFFATNEPATKEFVMKYIGKQVDTSKLWIVGLKDFGNSNGILYNKRNKETDCQDYKAHMKKGVLQNNELLKAEWGDRYIDLIALIIDSNNKVLVFTPDCKFISHDTLHLTQFGAIFFAQLLESRMKNILGII